MTDNCSRQETDYNRQDTNRTRIDSNRSSHAADRIAMDSRQAGRMMAGFVAVTAACIVFDRIYALFGHGVSSPAMSGMYLFPLLGGAVPFLLLWLFLPGWGWKRTGPAVSGPAHEPAASGHLPAEEAARDSAHHWRLFCNAWNSGVATLTVGSLLRGILEIAGTESAYVAVFTAIGTILMAIGALSLLQAAITCRLPSR